MQRYKQFVRLNIALAKFNLVTNCCIIANSFLDIERNRFENK